MPIDDEQITRAFRIPLRNQVAAMTLVLERLGRWLAARVKRAEAIERASRAYPSVRFYNEGLVLQITDHQYGAIAESAGREGPLAEVRRQWTQENALPLLLARLSDALLAIEQSVNRFATPSPKMFGKRTASDLFGLAGMAFSRAHAGRPQLHAFAESLAALKGPPSKQEKKPGEPPAVETTLADDLDGIAGALMGALALLPVLPALAAEYLKGASMRVKIEVLDLGDRIEEAVYGLREDVRGLFQTELLQHTGWMLQIIDLIGGFSKQMLGGWFELAEVFVTRWIDNWIVFADGLKRIFNYWMPLIATIADALAPLSVMVGKGATAYAFYERYDAFSKAHRRASRSAWDAMKRDAKGIYDWSRRPGWGPPPGATATARQALALARLTAALNYEPPTIRMATTAPVGNVEMHFSSWLQGIGERFTKRVGKEYEKIPFAVKQVIDSVDLHALAAPFSESAALGGEADLVRKLAGGAAATAEELFGKEARLVADRMAKQPIDPLAQALESWLIAGGGIDVIGKAIPIYAMEMDRWWRESRAKQTAADRAGGVSGLTSPRILAKRVRLRGVKLKELTIRARSRALDEDLAVLIAAEVRENVSAAYRKGFERIGRERPGRRN